MFKAYLEINGKRYRIFPRSKKINKFKTIKDATDALEKKTRHNVFNSRGYIYKDDELVLTMAL